MKELFFDTETTGLIPKGAKFYFDYDIFPYIVEIAWWFDGEMKNYIIKPEDWTIPEESIEIHGITNELALKEGHYFNDVIIEFIRDCSDADTIIAHNIYFDTSIVKANILRGMPDDFFEYASSAISKEKRIDTMFKTIKFVNARNDNGGCKFPSLSELYFKLFGEYFNAHSAKNDVEALMKCYYELESMDFFNKNDNK